MAVPLFSYGANMSRAVLEKRRVCTRKPGVPAIARDHALSFCHRGGYATLVPLTQLLQSEERWSPFRRSPHGVLYYVSLEEFARLMEKEVGYKVTDILVQCYGKEEEEGKLVPAKAFVSSPFLLLFAAVAPPAKYMSKIQQGAGENRLCVEYQDWLAKVRVAALPELAHDAYNATYADVGAKCFGFALLTLLTWALIN
ncbi:hypothetical protein DUNSADRAFT_10224 [Dunaliella salina]|uniref:gamma-glutamylcyclotransferase n=1 Tax=Dunaliella salina TaxID=3046 RepID=A0ABQ7GFU4_DUNSA|nr:hypothetical protein DUNSADRAFT_10224 [Dunaliella salina]|eukprot:KAF5833469.1 hypothetical protein DUNSADRAFT_10224 [Dunaliella salina]